MFANVPCVAQIPHDVLLKTLTIESTSNKIQKSQNFTTSWGNINGFCCLTNIPFSYAIAHGCTATLLEFSPVMSGKFPKASSESRLNPFCRLLELTRLFKFRKGYTSPATYTGIPLVCIGMCPRITSWTGSTKGGVESPSLPK